MKKEDVYIYYSGATDVTGKKLQDALGITGGADKPADKKLVIGWGAKTKKNMTFPAGVDVMNHPNQIKDNRNKFTTLQTLAASKVNVAKFVDAEHVKASLKNKDGVSLPLVGRTNFHQGGKGFWLCLTMTHLDNAIKEGAQYFQNYIDIVDEYRLHIFEGECIYAVKKVKRDNMEEAFIEQHGEKIKNIANKQNKIMDEDTLQYALGRLAKGTPNPDMIIRSNTRGWKFSHVKKPDANLVAEAVKALAAIKLNFGAVDCCIDADGKVWIIEINSGPGLQGTPFDAYVAAFEKVIASKGKPEVKKAPAKKVPAKKAAVVNGAGGGDKKALMRSKLDLMNEMLEVADDDEVDAIQSLWTKMANK